MRLFFTYFLLCVCSFGQVDLNGTNQWLVYSGDQYNIRTGLTLTAWINADSTSADQIIAHDAGASGRQYYLGFVSGSLYFNLRIGAVSKPIFVQYTNTGLRMVAATWYSNGLQKIYIDGISCVAATNAGILDSATSPVTIGVLGNYTTGPYDGIIDDARIYSRTLSQFEILDMYNRPWTLSDDPALILRTCLTTNDTGSTLAGAAYNYGSGASGTYSNSPKAAAGLIQHDKPRRETINID